MGISVDTASVVIPGRNVDGNNIAERNNGAIRIALSQNHRSQ